MKTLEALWTAAQAQLRLELPIGFFHTWVEPLQPLALNAATGEVQLGVQTAQQGAWLQLRLRDRLRRALADQAGGPLDLIFVVLPAKGPDTAWEPPLAEAEAGPPLPRSPEQWAAQGIPRRFAAASLATLDWTQPALAGQTELRAYLAQCAEYLQTGLGAVLVGSPGVGKTHIAVGVLKQMAETAGWTWAFVSAPDFLARLRATFDRPRGDPGDTEQQMMTHAQKVDCLVLDDVRLSDLTPWGRGVMYRLINDRYEQQRPLLMTTNVDLNDLVAASESAPGLNASTLSRLVEMSLAFRLTGSDYRVQRGQQARTRLRASVTPRATPPKG